MPYFDNNASTPADPRVTAAMIDWLSFVGNPSSPHRQGRLAREAIEAARNQVAALIECDPARIIFTSGGSEANNLIIKGYEHYATPHLAASTIEHEALLEPLRQRQGGGARVTLLPVTPQGVIDLAALDRLLQTDPPQLLSLMWANNETGVIQPIAEVAARCRAAGVLFHSDGVQVIGRLPVSLQQIPLNFLTLSAHKFHGPKGVGALVVDERVTLTPLIAGGGHERGLRAGTESLAAIVGMGVAATIARDEFLANAAQLRRLHDELSAQLAHHLGDTVIHGSGAARLDNTFSLALRGIEATTLIGALDQRGIALSAGSACGSHHDRPSHVLAAMAVPADLARCTLRISLGKMNHSTDLDQLIAALVAESRRLRQTAACAAWD
jgi:cysteine desulfurase